MKINKALVVGTLAVASLAFVGCGSTVEKAAKTDFSDITFNGYYTTSGQVYNAQNGIKLSELNGETSNKSNSKPDVIINDSPANSGHSSANNSGNSGSLSTSGNTSNSNSTSAKSHANLADASAPNLFAGITDLKLDGISFGTKDTVKKFKLLHGDKVGLLYENDIDKVEAGESGTLGWYENSDANIDIETLVENTSNKAISLDDAVITGYSVALFGNSSTGSFTLKNSKLGANIDDVIKDLGYRFTSDTSIDTLNSIADLTGIYADEVLYYTASTDSYRYAVLVQNNKFVGVVAIK